MLWSSFYGISASALNHLIKLVQHILTCVVPNLLISIKLFPESLYTTTKYLGFSNNIFDKYVICKKCGSLYTLNELQEWVLAKNNAIISHIATIPGHLAEILLVLI